jgi:hypothetical protein
MINQYEAFIEFEDIGLSDYIEELGWDIIAPTFPLNRHSAGDFQRANTIFHPNCKGKEKIYKRGLFLNRSVDQTKEVEIKKEKELTEKIQNIVQNSISQEVQKTVSTEIKNFFEGDSYQETINNSVKSSQTNTKNITNTNISSNEHNNTDINNFSQKISVDNIINQKLEESHSMTENMIIALEENVTSLQNTFIRIEINTLQQQVVNETKEIKKELDGKIDSTKKYFEDFLNG